VTVDLDKLPLPPGNRYVPVIGETRAFLKDAFGFIERRAAKHGPIFLTNIVGRPTVVLVGPAVSHVFLDEALCTRIDAMPKHLRELMGGRNVALLDGAEHHARKSHVVSAFALEALASYVPAMTELVESALAEWAARDEILAIDELQRLAFDVIARNVLSMQAGPDSDELFLNFKTLAFGFSAWPIPLPGTTYGKALKARDAIFVIWRHAIAEHRAKFFDDGLARMLAYRDEGGSALTDEETVGELHHIFIGAGVSFVEFARILVELAERPELRAALAEEARRFAAPTLTAGILGNLPLSWRFVQETKRLTRAIPVQFGRARRTFELRGLRIPAGATLLWAAHAHNQDPATFTRPGEFDPERFSEARAEHRRHEHGFAPQGMGPATGHKCPGIDYTTVLMQVFTTVLVRSFTWNLPEQNLQLIPSKVPPVYADGLRVVLRTAHPERTGS